MGFNSALKGLITVHFNMYSYYIYNFNLNFTDFICGVTTTLLITFLRLYSCNYNIAL
jgi:hypothetical protein